MYRCRASAAHHDEPEPPRSKRPSAYRGNDYKINLKGELIIDDLHKKLDLVLENQKKINRRLDKIEAEIAPENKEK